MYHYSFNIPDYRADTGHLTHLEHGIYRTLIDTYMLNESPLCEDTAKLMRTHKIRSKDEKEAFFNVLEDFFILGKKGYELPRCDSELEKIYSKSEKARASAKARWDKKNANAMRTQCEPDANDMLPINLIPNNLKPKIKDFDQQAEHDAKKNENDQLLENLFDQFWDSGIRKAGKKNARSVFRKILSGKVQKQEFTDYLIRDIQFRLTNEQQGFDLLHPTTYLRGERWTDEKLTRSDKPNNSGNGGLDFLDDNDTGWAEEICREYGIEYGSSVDDGSAQQEFENVVSVQTSMEELSEQEPRVISQGIPKPVAQGDD